MIDARRNKEDNEDNQKASRYIAVTGAMLLAAAANAHRI